ncbi:MAG: hypothetical protein ACOCVD_01695 [Bacillota bacterium]
MEIIAITGDENSDGRTKLGIRLIDNLRCNVGILKAVIDDVRDIMVTGEREIMRAEVPSISPYLNSSADKVLFMRTPKDKVKEAVTKAIDDFKDLDYLIFEGNKVVQYFSPGLIIHVNEPSKELSDDAEKCRSRADLIVDYYELLNDSNLADLRLKVVDDEISCYRAQLISDLFGLGYGEFGMKLDREGIQVRRCQLGLFK